MLDVVHITIYIDSIYRLQLDSVSGAYKKKLSLGWMFSVWQYLRDMSSNTFVSLSVFRYVKSLIDSINW